MFTSSYKLTISEYIDDGLSLWSKTTISMLPEGLALILSSRIPVCKQKYEKIMFFVNRSILGSVHDTSSLQKWIWCLPGMSGMAGATFHAPGASDLRFSEPAIYC